MQNKIKNRYIANKAGYHEVISSVFYGYHKVIKFIYVYFYCLEYQIDKNAKM